MIDQKLLEAYLSDYRPDLKAELIRTGQIRDYLATQTAAIQEARCHLMQEIRTHSPAISQTQMELEADQQIREVFLPLC